MDRNESKAFFLIALAFCIFFTFSMIGFGPSGNDDAEHLEMAKDASYTGTYAPLFRTISPLFAVQPAAWNFFILFLLCVVPPLLIFKITQEPLSVIFYYAISSFFYSFFIGLYAQLLVFIFILAILASKNNYVRVGLALIGSLSHTQAPYLMALTLFLVFLNDYAKEKMVLAIGGCSPFWGKKVPDAINGVSYVSPSGYVGNNLTVNNFLAFGVKICPLPFLFVAVRELGRKKRFDLLALLIVGIFGAFLYGPRVWLLAALIMIIGFSFAWKRLEHKRLWGAAVLGFAIFNFEQFVALWAWC